jgi:curved DNA-binding protein
MALADLYAELGVSKTTSAGDIKSAYRKLARELHPDRNPDDARAEDRFKRVSYAHDILSNDTKRKLYDEFGEVGLRDGFNADAARQPSGWGGGGGGAGFGGLEDILRQARGGAGFGAVGDMFGGGVEDLFGGRSAGGRGGRGGRTAEPAAAQAEITIDFEESLAGVERAITVRDQSGERSLRVRIPAGVDDGGKVRLKGQGTPNMRGGRGDLVLTVRVEAHKFFERDGYNLSVELPVTAAEAYRGASVTVPTPTGNVTMRLPEGVQSGAKLRLKGKGVPIPAGKKGDLFARVQVRLPSSRSEKIEKLLDELDDEYDGDVRSDFD